MGALNLVLGMAGSPLAKQKVQHNQCCVPSASLWGDPTMAVVLSLCTFDTTVGAYVKVFTVCCAFQQQLYLRYVNNGVRTMNQQHFLEIQQRTQFWHKPFIFKFSVRFFFLFYFKTASKQQLMPGKTEPFSQ